MKAASLLALVLVASASSRGGAAAPASIPLLFEQHVRPIFKVYCFDCHGEGEKLKAGLDLRLRRLILDGGKSGAVLVPGKRGESLLFKKISKHKMPPGKKKLSQEEIALIGRWIDAGARTARSEPRQVGQGVLITPDERAFWAFQPIRRPAVPPLNGASQVRTPVDAFVQAKLEEKKLTFSPDAGKETLIRRAYFDLIGLPPAPDDVARFLADRSPGAYDRLIDRLLASPRYGERWGRHWLDVAGYADSEGYTSADPVRRDAFKYRDYVIRSLNVDMPFDQFIREQLAGDEMVRPPYRNLSPADVDKLVATGFLRTAPDGTASRVVDQALARNQVVAETIKIVSTSLLGLTVGCAQCHNHKYDPIPQADYYRLRAIFEPAFDCRNWRSPRGRRISLATDADRRQAARIEAEAARIDAEHIHKTKEYVERTFEKELQKLPKGLREPVRRAWKTPPDQRFPGERRLLKENPSVNVSAGSLYLYDPKAAAELKKIAERAAAVRATKPVEEYVRALTEVPGRVPATYLFYRGDHTRPKEALLPGELTVLAAGAGAIPAKDPALPTTGRRLAYARWLTSGKHPLLARVLVNRVWWHHFGRGIVGTPGDFGFLGERPTHPELLDWLADDFMAGGWKLKRLHKLIMTSTVFRQASRPEPPTSGGSGDPDNRLYGRMALRRLDAEALRDSILAVAGKLNARMFGRPVPVMEDEVGQFVIGIDNKNDENRPGPVLPMHGEEFRRSVYVQARRTRPLALLDTFDAPAMDPNCTARASSTVAPQSLMLMNSDFIVTQAGYFAERVRRQAGSDPRAQVIHAWRLAFGAAPSAAEIQDATSFLAEQRAQFGNRVPPKAALDAQAQALASFCQVLISSNRFLYVD
ncbi:MAG TPA: PSD1 and planctomycete cytochrome C domain-containing protein [Gemmataceae bacterium]|jgi:mono/diheme cytochrome c family protein|nr:PSD1 and planctomycete cytochrome C domain-containing protein [Gemmataceae bacterium]